MTHIYVLTFMETNEKFYYTTLAAIAEAHSKHELKISPSTVRCLKFKDTNLYENRLITIERVVLRKRSDIIKMKSEQY